MIYTYYKIEEQHERELSKFLVDKEIPFENRMEPFVYVCQEMVNRNIATLEDDLQPIFRKIEDQLVDKVSSKFNTDPFIETGFNLMIADAIKSITKENE